MYLTRWEPSNFNPPTKNRLGGYLGYFTKETVSLKKKEAKRLNKVINQLINFSEVEIKPLGTLKFEKDDFIFTETTLNGPKLPIVKPWKCPSVTATSNLIRTQKSFQKEKIKLSIEETSYFKYIALPFVISSNPDIPLKWLTNFSYEFSDIYSTNSLYKSSTLAITKLKTSKKLKELTEVLEEKLAYSLNQDIIPKHVLDVEPLTTINCFLLNHISSKIEDTQPTPLPDLPGWKVKLKEENSRLSETFFKELEDKFFDIQFHKLEFFKLSCTQRLPRKVTKRKKIKKYWILSNPKLKQMGWSPFKIWSSPTMFTKFQNEQINLTQFKIPSVSLNVDYIPNTCLELFDMNNKTLCSNFQINTECAGHIPSSITLLTEFKEKSKFKDGSKDTSKINNSNDTFGQFETTTINTSVIPQKRSFLECDLQSLIEKKKNGFKQHKIQQKNNQQIHTNILEEDVTEIFQSGIFERTEESSLENSSNIISKLNETAVGKNTSIFSLSFKLETNFNIEDKLVIFNVDKIKENYKLLQSLIYHTKPCCTIIERKLFSSCDLILNSCTCLIRIQLEKFFQRDGSNNLHYFDIISTCLAEYKRIKVLVEYKTDTLLYDKDMFWKTLYFLPFPNFELFFVPKDDSSVLLQRVKQLIQKEAQNRFNENDFIEENMKGTELLLSKLKLNPILIKALLAKYTLTTLLSQVSTGMDPHLMQIMTLPQINRLKRLNNINW